VSSLLQIGLLIVVDLNILWDRLHLKSTVVVLVIRAIVKQNVCVDLSSLVDRLAKGILDSCV
jgi:hypothetical protein